MVGLISVMELGIFPWGIPRFFDRELPFGPGGGREEADQVIEAIERDFLPHMSAG